MVNPMQHQGYKTIRQARLFIIRATVYPMVDQSNHLSIGITNSYEGTFSFSHCTFKTIQGIKYIGNNTMAVSINQN